VDEHASARSTCRPAGVATATTAGITTTAAISPTIAGIATRSSVHHPAANHSISRISFIHYPANLFLLIN
jgi:hypothetical protein